LIVRPLEERDVDAVLAIQVDSPETAQWNREDYMPKGRPGIFGLVAEKAAVVTGFLVARQVLDEVEILNLAVRGESRRQGAGSALLSAALRRAKNDGAKGAYLEVRASNSAAISFYRRHGFNITGRRDGYYSSPTDDALILALVLAKNED
jgi:ribosomal-protein-alanine N-acetyltransferase